jgi:hypothetical protein
MLALGLLLNSSLALAFTPLIAITCLTSILTGKANRNLNYYRIILSTIPYLLVTLIVFLREPPIVSIITLLTFTEASRIFFLTKYFPELFMESNTYWKSGLLFLIAVSFGGIAPITDRLIATLLNPGDVTILTYAVAPVTVTLTGISYSLALSYINNHLLEYRKLLKLTLVSIPVYLVVCLILHITIPQEYWIHRVILPSMLAYPWLFLAVMSIKEYSIMIKEERPYALVVSGFIFLMTNILGNFMLLSFGIYGILISTLIAQSTHVIISRKINEYSSIRIREAGTTSSEFTSRTT